VALYVLQNRDGILISKVFYKNLGAVILFHVRTKLKFFVLGLLMRLTLIICITQIIKAVYCIEFFF
jgi:hypothetical protein